MKKYEKKIPCEGEAVFVGIDVHKKKYSIVAMIGREVVKKWTTESNPHAVAQQLLRYFPGKVVQTAYEAGFSGFVLHRVLTQAGISNLVVHAAGIEVAASDRVKTDRRDATKLAGLLSVGRLKGIRIPSLEEEQKRILSRTREQYVLHRTRLRLQIRMKLHQFGLIWCNDPRELTLRMVSEILKRELSAELRLAIESMMALWKNVDGEIRQLERELEKQASNDACEKIYRSAPGIGPLSARMLSNELGDMSRFRNERALYSFTGLTPSEYTSGETIKKGHISRQGPGRLRGVLVEAAWRAIREDRDLRQLFERLYPRTGKKRAIVAVARHLIGRIRAALRKNELYRIQIHEISIAA